MATRNAALSPLLNAIEAHESSFSRNSELSKERVQSLKYYLGEPFGNEVEGRSQVVSRDVADTIEWIKPSLMRIFASGDDIISFDPRGPEDVETAQQETDFVNYILTQKNNWFLNSYVWFTDALMQKNAYIKAWYEEKTDVTTEKYEGLTEGQILLLKNDPEIALTKEEAYPDPSFIAQPNPMAQGVGQMMGAPMAPPVLYKVEAKRTSVYGCVKYKAIPPERVIVSNWASSVDLEDVDFFEHFEWRTLSDVKAEGLEVPELLGDESESGYELEEEEARNLYGEPWEDEESSDPALRRYKVRECWIRFDDDGDGIAELLHVIVMGRVELLKEEVEFVPAAAITPTMMPHRHIGRSVADSVMDLQLIKSTLLRGTLDNMYLGNNGRYGVNEKRVNLDDMLTSRPGGIVRVDGIPGNDIFPFSHPNMMGDGLKAIEYVDNIKQNRTGVTAYVTSVDENVLNKTASGTSMLQNAAMAKIELIARVFAETGVKRLMWLVHALTLKHARKAETVRLRNKWVDVDPRQWKKRVDMTVSVGLGTGNRDQQMMHLGTILGLQKEVLQIGLATPETIHHALSKFTQAAGFKDSQAFWKQPPEGAQIQPPQDPALKIKEMEVQAEAQKTQFTESEETKRTEMEIMSKERIEGAKIAADTQREDMRLKADAQKTAFGAHVDREGQAMQMQHDGQIKDRELRLKEQPVEETKVVSTQVEQMAQMVQALGEAVIHLQQAVSAEKEVVRDPKTNRIMGARIKQQEVQ